MSEDIHKYPSQTADRFQVRMPEGLRERIRLAAEKNGRSMNTEIVMALESQFPEPITVDQVASDIQEVLRIMKRMSGPTMLMHLADQLDELMFRISQDPSTPPKAKGDAEQYVNERAKFTRFVPPDDVG